MTFPLRAHVLRHYKNETWEGIVVGSFRATDGHIYVVCEAIGKEFKQFVSDPSHLKMKEITSNYG